VVVCKVRPWCNEPVSELVALHGSKISVLVGSLVNVEKSKVNPPVIRTRPSARRVAVWFSRACWRLPYGAN
jgi:hypothetical protein